MTTSRSAALLRRWVALYTAGLPRDIRDARRAEIEDDLWSQAQEAEQLGASAADGASGDVLARLAFGLWADITWRLEQRHRAPVRPVLRSSTMGTRLVAAASIIGGLALAIASIPWAGPLDNASPVAVLGRFLLVTGFVGLAIAIWGLVARFNDRISGGVAMLGALGGLGSAMAGLGAAMSADGAGGAFIFLPIGSAAVALDLSRHATMPRGLAIVHSAAAFAVVFILLAIWTNSPIGALIYPRVPYTLPWVPYALTWIAIGAVLRRGQPVTDHPVASVEAP